MHLCVKFFLCPAFHRQVAVFSSNLSQRSLSAPADFSTISGLFWVWEPLLTLILHQGYWSLPLPLFFFHTTQLYGNFVWGLPLVFRGCFMRTVLFVDVCLIYLQREANLHPPILSSWLLPFAPVYSISYDLLSIIYYHLK